MTRSATEHKSHALSVHGTSITSSFSSPCLNLSRSCGSYSTKYLIVRTTRYFLQAAHSTSTSPYSLIACLCPCRSRLSILSLTAHASTSFSFDICTEIECVSNSNLFLELAHSILPDDPPAAINAFNASFMAPRAFSPLPLFSKPNISCLKCTSHTLFPSPFFPYSLRPSHWPNLPRLVVSPFPSPSVLLAFPLLTLHGMRA